MKTRISVLLTLAFALSARDAAGANRTADAIIADAKARVIQISNDLVVTTTVDAAARIKKADEHLEGLKGVLAEYARAPRDPTTAPTAAEWQRYVDRMDETLETLKRLQEASSGIQARTTELIGECTAAESVLADKVKAALAAQDPSVIPLLAAQAEKVEKLVDPELDDLLADLKQTEQMRAMVERFDASGVWDAVENNLEAAARALVEANLRARKAVFASCEQLALGDAHRRIIEATNTLKQLQTQAFNNMTQLRAGHQRFLDALKALREWHEHEVEKFRLALCDIDEEEKGGGLKGDVIAALGKRITDEMIRRRNEIIGAADQLIAAIDRMKGGLTKADKDNLDKLRKDIARVRDQVNNAVNGSPWAKGANNPIIRLHLEAGKQEHLEYQRNSSYCTAAEVVVSGGRIDCVKVDGNKCKIIELKPNTPRAVAKGWGQVEGYRKTIYGMWNNGKGSSAFNSNGLQVFLRCQQGTQLNLTIDVQQYKFCPGPGKLSGDLLP